jgi:hypothetical protein
MSMSRIKRRYPIGAELIGKNQTNFRVWAPKAREVDVVLESTAGAELQFCSLTAESGGYFSAAADAGAGVRYRFRVNGAENFYPDPASRSQPHGPHGSSCIVDPEKFVWSDAGWPGLKLKGQIFYEMHIGTFTKEGTWRAATEQLPELARIGITVIEMMPVAEFPGEFGWGYDGVDLFAPSHLYGTPDDLRAFIDRVAPNPGEIARRKAAALLAGGDGTGALASLRAALALDPVNDDARLDLAALLLERPADGEAVKEARELVSKASPLARQTPRFRALQTRLDSLEQASDPEASRGTRRRNQRLDVCCREFKDILAADTRRTSLRQGGGLAQVQLEPGRPGKARVSGFHGYHVPRGKQCFDMPFENGIDALRGRGELNDVALLQPFRLNICSEGSIQHRSVEIRFPAKHGEGLPGFEDVYDLVAAANLKLVDGDCVGRPKKSAATGRCQRPLDERNPSPPWDRER